MSKVRVQSQLKGRTLSKMSLFCSVALFFTVSTQAYNSIVLDQPGMEYHMTGDFVGIVAITASDCKFYMHGYKITSYASKTNVGIQVSGGLRCLVDGGGGSINNFNTGVYVQAGTPTDIKNVDIYTSNWGVLIENCAGIRINNVYVQGSTYDAFATIGCVAVNLMSAYSWDARRVGFFDQYGNFMRCSNSTFRRGRNDGVICLNTNEFTVENLQSNENAINGVSLFGTTHHVSMKNSNLGGTNGNTNYGLYLALSGNYFWNYFEACTIRNNWHTEAGIRYDLKDPNYTNGTSPSQYSNVYNNCSIGNRH